MITRGEFYLKVPELRNAWKRIANAHDDVKRGFVTVLLDTMDKLDMPDGAYWQVVEDIMGGNYADELFRLGMLEEAQLEDHDEGQ